MNSKIIVPNITPMIVITPIPTKTPKNTGIWGCFEDREMVINWVLSPNSARKITMKVTASGMYHVIFSRVEENLRLIFFYMRVPDSIKLVIGDTL